MTLGRLLLCLGVGVLAAPLAPALLLQARAAPLDADTCGKLRGEQEQLDSAGIEKDIAKGPAWGKANLAPDRLAQVRRFIELEEQIVFRCRGKSLVTLPPEPEVAAVSGDADNAKSDGAKQPDAAAAPAPVAPTANPAPAGQAPKSPASPAKQTTKEKTPAAKPAAKKEAAPGKNAPQPNAAANPKASAAQPKKQESAAKKPAPNAGSQPGAAVTEIPKSPPKAKVDDSYKPPSADPDANPFATQSNLR